MSTRPYLSIDIETTGLDLSLSQILEVGAVLDDGVNPIEKLETMSAVIQHDSFEYCTPYAMKINQRLIDIILKKEGQPSKSVFKELIILMNRCSMLAMAWDEAHDKKPNKRISIAGKNAAVFDIPILENQISSTSGLLVEEFRSIKNHRVIDPGSMYFHNFGYIPTLDEIKRLLNLGTVSHKAVEDALDVVHAIRYKGCVHTGGTHETPKELEGRN